MTTSHGVHDSGDWGGRLTPSDVHHVLFSRAGLGRRGYDEVEVDVFLERVQQELTRLIGEREDLRNEVAQVKAELARAGFDAQAPAPDESLTQEMVRRQAAGLLAAAQQAADIHIANAEKHSQRLIADARKRSEAMLQGAEKAAQHVLEEAQRLSWTEGPRSTGASDPSSQQELQQQVARLETSGRMLRVQLRAYLEALLRDVEEEWDKADPGGVAGAPTVVSHGTSGEDEPDGPTAAQDTGEALLEPAPEQACHEDTVSTEALYEDVVTAQAPEPELDAEPAPEPAPEPESGEDVATAGAPDAAPKDGRQSRTRKRTTVRMHSH